MFTQYRAVIIALFIGVIMLFFIWQNNDIIVTQVNYTNTKISKEFEGYTIAHISDLHNKGFGNNQKNLLKKIQGTSPDIIVITGDLIDRRKYDLDTAMVFIHGAMDIAPVYYVSGNHEAWSGDYENIRNQLQSSGVQILDDHKVELIKGAGTIEILGLSDPAFLTSNYMDKTNLSTLKKQLITLSDNSAFQILLSHRPELFDVYANEQIDLIFSGHAHGGQFRLPFIGGLIAPNQGLFPKYTSGVYTQNESTLVVSRGLGNSILPVRIFNRPEILVVTLHERFVD